MKYTDNYNLRHPEDGDFFDIPQDVGESHELIDAALKGHEDRIGESETDISDLKNPAFEDYTGSTTVPSAATALAEIKSKMSIFKFFSSVKAFCKGCVTLAMIVNNCTSSDTDKPLSAAQGKFLLEKFNELNSDLINIKPTRFTLVGTFYGFITRNASSICGNQLNISITIATGNVAVPVDVPFMYINKKLYSLVVPVMLGNYSIGYIFSGTNENNDTVFYWRSSAGSVPVNTEIYIDFNAFIVG